MQPVTLDKVFHYIEPGPVMLLTTADKGRANVMTFSWHMMLEFVPPLIVECLANFECKVENTRLVNAYCLFVLKVVRAWVTPGRKEQRRIHANGDGTFVVDGRVLNLKKRMVKWQDML